MNQTEAIERAKEHFARLLEGQLKRVEQMKAGEDWADYSKIKPIIVGVVGGDGIGPVITNESFDAEAHKAKVAEKVAAALAEREAEELLGDS